MKDNPSYFLFLAAVLIAPLLFGAVHTYAYTLVFLMVLAGTIFLLPAGVEAKAGAVHVHWIKTGMGPLFIGIFVLIVFQMIPIPDAILAGLSPESKAAGDMSYPPGIKGSLHALSAYLYPVRMSLVRWIVYGFLFLGLVRTLNSRKRIESAVIFILILCCFEAVYGILETYSRHAHIWWWKHDVPIRDVSGTYINRNHFAGLMEMGIILAIAYSTALAENVVKARKNIREKILAYFSRGKKSTKFLLVLFAGVIMVLGLFLSASRGGVIAVTGAALVTGLFLFSRKRRSRAGKVVFLLFVVSAIYVAIAGTAYTVGRFQVMGPEYQNRLRYMQNTINLFTDYPLAGVGIGNYAQAFSRWQSPDDRRFSMDYAHNDWVQFAAEAGVLGLFILIAGILFFVYALLKKWKSRHDPFAVSLGIAPLGAMAAIGIHSYSDFNLHIPANFMMLTAIAAIGWSALHLERHRGGEKIVYRTRSLPIRKGGIVLLLLMSAAILWSGYWMVRHFAAEACCGTVPNSTLKIDWNPPAEQIRQAIAWDPSNAEYRYKLAREFMGSRDREAAESGIDTARWQEWNPPIISALEEAIRLNPWKSEYHMHLGRHYSYLWNRPDYHSKWLPAADVEMERASYTAGAGAENPHILLDIGNYWAMRSNMIDSTDPNREVVWTKAVWNYRKALELDKSKEFRAAVMEQVKTFYPDEENWKQVLP